VASQDEQIDDAFDIDAELNAWMEKKAAEQGVDPNDLYAGELEVIKRWQESPNPEDFEWLYNTHQPMIFRAGERYIRSATIPKNAVKGSLLRGYVDALETYDPTRGTKFISHFYNGVGRTGRYLQKYTNVGRIPEDRAGLISLMQSREAELKDQFGRLPTDTELADDMLLSAADIAAVKNRKITPKLVGTLRHEIRQDRTAELTGGAAETERDSKLRRQIVFLHGSLNPEQQLVLEHTFEGFGKPVVEDDLQLAQQLNLSPQKIRALKTQIRKKVERFW
jgi:DNA-directed RNA polymerase specialized sigma subunit